MGVVWRWSTLTSKHFLHSLDHIKGLFEMKQGGLTCSVDAEENTEL